jgi:hypothetical protein
VRDETERADLASSPARLSTESSSSHACQASQNDPVENSDPAQEGTAIPARKPGRTRRIITITAAGLAAVVIGSLIVAEVVAGAIGCGSVDPTDPSNYSTATIVNDTATAIRIGDCQGTYCGPQPSATLAPRQHTAINGACGVSGTDMTSWKVTGSDGRLLGYIAIDTPRSTHDLTFNISDASRDRTTPTKPN